MTNPKKLVSIIVPVFNEQDNIPAVYEQLVALADSLKDSYDFELLFTDNRSTDASFALLKGLATKDERIVVIRFSRNFGYQRSILCGYIASRGDAIVQLDCDLEDPPDLIKDFLKFWKEGYQVVYGVRGVRKESRVKTALRNAFYALIDYLAEEDLPRGAGDFRLIDRVVANQLVSLHDESPYLRGSIAAMGFEQKSIAYSRNERMSGKSKFSMSNNISLALDGILNHSVIPLRLASIAGFGMVILSVILAVGYIYLRLTKGTELPAGFTTIVLLQLFATGLICGLMGILGEYLGRIYKQVKAGPTTIIDKTVGLTSAQRDELEQKLIWR